MEGIWFNDKTQRRIMLRSATLLVGKAPTKQKRIKSMVTMKLDSGGEDQIAGLPEWLENARDFVMRNGETITASHAIQEANIVMGDTNLFRKTPIEAPKTRLDHFVIKQMGDAEDPDTVLCFEMRSPFSTDLWGWFGQMGGEEFDVTFELVGSSRSSEQETGEITLTSEDEDDEEEEEDDASEDDGEEDEDDPEVIDARNNHGQGSEDDDNYMGPEHDEAFRTTPLVTHASRRRSRTPVIQ